MKTMQNVNKISVLPTSCLVGNKKGMMAPLAILGIVVIAAIGGAVVYSKYMDKDEKPALTITKEITKTSDGTYKVADKQALTAVGSAQCGDAGTTSFDAIVVNPLDEDGTPTYSAVGIKLFQANGEGAMMSYTTDSDGTFASSSLTLSCPEGYDVYIPAVQNLTASGKTTFSADKAVKNIQAEIDTLDFIQVRARDNINNADVYDSGDASATDYEDLTAGAVTFKSSTNNATATTLGVGDELDMTFRLKTDAQKSWGDLVNYVVVDADSSDYEEPVLYLDGTPLKEVGKAGLPHEDDQGYLSSYEYVFVLPKDITEQASELKLVMNGKSSINPDADVVLRFVASSISIDGLKPRMSIFNQGGSEILMSSAQTITIDIA